MGSREDEKKAVVIVSHRIHQEMFHIYIYIYMQKEKGEGKRREEEGEELI